MWIFYAICQYRVLRNRGSRMVLDHRLMIKALFHSSRPYNNYALSETEGFEVAPVLKLHEGRPNVLDLIKNRQVQLIFNTPSGSDAHTDGRLIRQSALAYKIP